MHPDPLLQNQKTKNTYFYLNLNIFSSFLLGVTTEVLNVKKKGKKERRKEGRKEGGREGQREERKKGRKEERKKERKVLSCTLLLLMNVTESSITHTSTALVGVMTVVTVTQW
jgi:predicted transposase YdaD